MKKGRVQQAGLREASVTPSPHWNGKGNARKRDVCYRTARQEGACCRSEGEEERIEAGGDGDGDGIAGGEDLVMMVCVEYGAAALRLWWRISSVLVVVL